MSEIQILGHSASTAAVRIVFFASAIGLLGCPSSPDASSRGKDNPDQQTQEAESSAGAWNPWQISPTPTVVIGESGGVEYALARVGDAQRYGEGFVVPVSLPKGIRLYDKEGRFQRQLGREGEGPGEFRAVSGTWVTEGDTVVAYDSFLHRVTYFDPGGDLLQTVPFHAGGSFVVGEERPRYIVDRFSDGSFLSVQEIYPPLPNAPDPELTTSSKRFVREVPGTSQRDTITHALDWDVAWEEEPGLGLGAWVAVPFTPTTSGVVRDSVLYVADSRRFEIEAWSSSGELLARYVKEHEVVPITDDVWDGELERWERNFLARMESTGNRQRLNIQSELAGMRRRFRGKKRLPNLPVHGRRILADSDGNIWLEAWPDDLDSPSPIWHLFLAEAERFVGTVEMPPRFRPTAIYSEAVVGIHTDELDVQSVREYPILR